MTSRLTGGGGACPAGGVAAAGQVHRVLKPGGKFFATTFLWGVPDDLIGLSINLSGPNRRCGEGEGRCKGKSQERGVGRWMGRKGGAAGVWG